MSFTLKKIQGDQVLFTSGNEKTWWQNGFVLGTYSASDLRMEATIQYSPEQSGLMDDFVDNFSHANASITQNKGSNTISIIW